MNIATRIQARVIAGTMILNCLAACAASPAVLPGIACEQLLEKTVPASALTLRALTTWRSTKVVNANVEARSG